MKNINNIIAQENATPEISVQDLFQTPEVKEAIDGMLSKVRMAGLHEGCKSSAGAILEMIRRGKVSRHSSAKILANVVRFCNTVVSLPTFEDEVESKLAE